jgi:hypothetical protein
VHTGFWWEDLKESDHLEDVGINGSKIIKCIIKKWHAGSIKWIALAQDRNRRWALVNAGMNLRVP